MKLKIFKEHERELYISTIKLYSNDQETQYICRRSVCESNVNECVVGGVYWGEKGHMVPEAMGDQPSDSICHSVLTVSHCSAVHAHEGM